VLERHAGAPGGGASSSLVEFRPLTGRQHQIRVHARYSNCPILGDRLYAPQGVRDRAPRLMLHAFSLGFRHPGTTKEIEIVAPVPPDFESMRQRLATD
jgi:23S rRNA-/tRNA-specific pseudouridylate synthase